MTTLCMIKHSNTHTHCNWSVNMKERQSKRNISLATYALHLIFIFILFFACIVHHGCQAVTGEFNELDI